jgi:MarR family 2-MHQ and catechol resistance regulon transcriptional repressor
MTAAVNRLVERTQDPADGRSFKLNLTDSGFRLIDDAYETHARNLEKIAGVLTAEERRELVRLLKKIGRHANEVAVD